MVWFFNNSVKNEAVITVILGFFPFKTDNNFILTPSLHSEEVFEFLTPSQVVFLNNEVLHVQVNRVQIRLEKLLCFF